MSKRLTRIAVVAGIALAASAAVVPPTPALAGNAHRAAAVPRWRIVERAPRDLLNAVVAPSATSAWALGEGNFNQPLGASVALHWNGRRWASASLASQAPQSTVVCASASSPSNVWAFTNSLNFAASAIRLRHGRWVREKQFTNGGSISDCHVLSAHDVWVFGGGVAAGSPFIGTWHLSGSRWSQPKTSALLFTASVDRARDVWAIGERFPPVSKSPTPEVVRWNGRSFARVGSLAAALPHSDSWDAVAINALSRRNVWAKVTDGFSLAVLRWNGRRWHRVGPASAGYYLPGAVSDGHGGWWAFPPAAGVGRYLLHEAHGRWRKFALPLLHGHRLLVQRMIHVPRSGAMLAVGWVLPKNGQPLGSVVLAFGRLPR